MNSKLTMGISLYFRFARLFVGCGLILLFTACSSIAPATLPTATGLAVTVSIPAAATQTSPAAAVPTQTQPPVHVSLPTPTSFPLLIEPDWISYTNANFIRTMLIDREGNLWTGGSGGVVHWDIQTGIYTKYTVDHGLAGNFVTSIAQENNGTIWFGTYGAGVARFDGQSWTTFTTQDGLIDNEVLGIWAAKDGILWFGTSRGVSAYDGQAWRSYSGITSGDPVGEVTAIAETPDGRLWFGGPGGLRSYFEEQWQIEDIPENSVNALAVSPDGSLWVGAMKSVMHWNGRVWESFPSEGQVSSIAVSPNGVVWVGYSLMNTLDMRREALDLTTYSFPRVSQYNGEDWTQIDPPAGLIEEDVRSIQVGPDGTVWFGSFSRGVVRYDGSAWRTFQTMDQQCSNFIGVLAAAQSEVWFGYPGGLAHFDGQKWTCLTQLGDLGLNRNAVFAIHMQPDRNQVLVGTMYGLAVFNGTDWITYSQAQFPWLTAVEAIIPLPDNSYLVGTDQGVYQFDGEKWSALWKTQKIIQAIQVTGDGLLWLGTIDGIYASKGGDWKHFVRVTAPISMTDRMLLAPDQTLWVANCVDGLAQLDGSEWKTYSAEGGDLPGSCVLALAIDQKGGVWVGTTRGLAKYDGKVWYTYQTKDGLADNYIRGVTVGPNGEIWIATIAGISVVK